MHEPLSPDERLVLEALLERRERSGDSLGGFFSLCVACAALPLRSADLTAQLRRLAARRILLADVHEISGGQDGRRDADYCLDLEAAQAALDERCAPLGPRSRVAGLAG